MNFIDKNILINLKKEPYINQRILAENTGFSVGTVNQSIKNLVKEKYLTSNMDLTNKTITEFNNNKPNSAIILAAGFGMRMVPINLNTNKGLLEVDNEKLIERLIKQLHEKEIFDIYIVVGFMKEKFEYLIDKYNIHLIINNQYSLKNNIHSLLLALPFVENTYIIPCDIWCSKNPFSCDELYSWYMVSDIVDNKSYIRVNRKYELVKNNFNAGNQMIGISYLTKQDKNYVQKQLEIYDSNNKYNDVFWEEALLFKEKFIVNAKIVSFKDVVEIDTYEQLLELDNNSNDLNSDAISIICDSFNVDRDKIKNIEILKKGMTNRSFLFKIDDQKYIMRIPGEGTDQLINREQEANVYNTIKKFNLCDDIIYINPNNGYKITKYIENSRVCDPNNDSDLRKSIKFLKRFHNLKLQVKHRFDIFDQINYYENLWNGEKSYFIDYKETKNNIFKIKKYLKTLDIEECLTHIDAVPDNFLFYNDDDIKLIDWEYSAMQDPHVDIAMFAIYSLYNKEQIDNLINIYFDNNCTDIIKTKIYCYIAMCGLLWSNWCEYKRTLGVEFGEYSIAQYRYAKEYYKLVEKEISKVE